MFAGCVPHDKRFVAQLPLSKIEGHPIARCLMGRPRILPPLVLSLPAHCVVFISLLWSGLCLGYVWVELSTALPQRPSMAQCEQGVVGVF